jgi:hypothetical protein
MAEKPRTAGDLGKKRIARKEERIGKNIKFNSEIEWKIFLFTSILNIKNTTRR